MFEMVTFGEWHVGDVVGHNDDGVVVSVIPSRAGVYPSVSNSVRMTWVGKDGIYEQIGSVTAVLPGRMYPKVHVRLEAESTKTNRRDGVRRDANLNVEVRLGGLANRCVTKDAGGNGLSILTGQILPILDGTVFDISLNVPDGRPPLRAKCGARFVREIFRNNRWLIEAKFLQITETDRLRIIQHVLRWELSTKRSGERTQHFVRMKEGDY